MPELRRDELSGGWVLLAPGRAARPHTFPASSADARTAPADCPFCPGNEQMTPPEVYRTGGGAPDTPQDVARMMQAAEAWATEILGPPPELD